MRAFLFLVALSWHTPHPVTQHHMAGGGKPDWRLIQQSDLGCQVGFWKISCSPSPGAYFGRLLVILQSVCDKTSWDLADNDALHAAAWNLGVCCQPQGPWHKGNRAEALPAGGGRG